MTYECAEINSLVSKASYGQNDVVMAYPITPSSGVAEAANKLCFAKRKNIFGEVVEYNMMQSEKGVASAMLGATQAGCLTMTATCSQGLLLMLPSIYQMAGAYTGGVVFHVASRGVCTHSGVLDCDHSDVMTVARTGAIMLSSNSAQEAVHHAACAMAIGLECNLPVVHFFDGLRIGRSVNNVQVPSREDISEVFPHDKADEYRNRGVSNKTPSSRNPACTNSIHWQITEAGSHYWDEAADKAADVFAKFQSAFDGKLYKPFDYTGHPEAEHVVVMMGSGASTTEETVKRLVAEGKKVGVIAIHLYRPFSAKHFLSVLPESCKRITVLDKTREMGASVQPVYADVLGVLQRQMHTGKTVPMVYGGTYGISGYEFTPGMVLRVFENMTQDLPKHDFNIGIYDDINGRGLEMPKQAFDVLPEGTTEAVVWGCGGDGTISANRNMTAIVSSQTELNAQAYFVFDAKKTSGTTISHIRFAKEEIRAPYLVDKDSAAYVAIHKAAYLQLYPNLITNHLKPGGIFLINCDWTPEQADEFIPDSVKRSLAEKKAQIFFLDAHSLAEEVGLGSQRINNILTTAFFALSKLMDVEAAIPLFKDAITKMFSVKGPEIVRMNIDAVDGSLERLHKFELPAHWMECDPTLNLVIKDAPDVVNNIIMPVLRFDGPNVPVSVLKDSSFHLGVWPTDTTRWEKRRTAVKVPTWEKDNCIQCGRCVNSCPHATIRPAVCPSEQAAPVGWDAMPMRGKNNEGFDYRIQVFTEDCMGCTVCTKMCPKDCLTMVDNTEEHVQQNRPLIEFTEKEAKPSLHGFGDAKNIKNAQFLDQVFQFSGACPGCVEASTVRLLTQIFGSNRLMLSIAIGCVLIYSQMLVDPYTVDEDGNGPVTQSSLFENVTTFGLGSALGIQQKQRRLVGFVEEAVEDETMPEPLREVLTQWKEADREGKVAIAKKVQHTLAEHTSPSLKKLVDYSDLFVPKSNWILMGDGAAYDIDFDGLDHILASGKNVNVLVFQNEVYANTGGQVTKATSRSAVAKFCSEGKDTMRKDLARMIVSTYPDVFVSTIAVHTRPQQAMKAFVDADSYDGPSLIVAACPCIAWGIRGHAAGMANSPLALDLMCQTGLWTLMTRDPRLPKPLKLHSRKPSKPVREFTEIQNRFLVLERSEPERAQMLQDRLQQDVDYTWKQWDALIQVQNAEE
ncbi:hypothetical protein PCE1_004425 [Barthelona sp. PCE]